MERKRNNGVASDLLKLGLGALVGAAIFFIGNKLADKEASEERPQAQHNYSNSSNRE